jgi:uncharacterized protein
VILEGLVTTLGPDDVLNVAPMGPRCDGNWSRFVLRPFRTSTTYRNLKERGEGVLHVTDDVLLLALAAIGPVPDAETRPADVVRGRILLTSAHYHEFRVFDIDDRDERATIRVETVASGRLRELFGLNRAKHAVVEAAILATRVAFLPIDAIRDDLMRLAPLVEKTGGPDEREAFERLRTFIELEASR